jgi:hypothetical protein
MAQGTADSCVTLPGCSRRPRVEKLPGNRDGGLAEQERLEAWIMDQVQGGASLPGLYPPNAESKARYEATKPKR